MDQARLVVVVTDSDCTDESASLFSQATAAGKGAFLVYNKEDMSQVPCYGAVADRPGCYRISARYGYGIDELRKGLLKGGVGDVNSGDVMLTNERHLEAMKRILAALAEVRKGLDVNLTADLLAIDLRDALYHLGTITGVITSDDILSSVFSRFCVGK